MTEWCYWNKPLPPFYLLLFRQVTYFLLFWRNIFSCFTILIGHPSKSFLNPVNPVHSELNESKNVMQNHAYDIHVILLVLDYYHTILHIWRHKSLTHNTKHWKSNSEGRILTLCLEVFASSFIDQPTYLFPINLAQITSSYKWGMFGCADSSLHTAMQN